MATTKPLVYIIILNYNGYEDTIACLESLWRNDYPSYRVVVVDNASPNGSEARLREYQQASGREFTFIQAGENRGFSAGNNVGIRYALEHGADLVWLLNNDTEIEPDALTKMVDKIATDKSIGICGSRLMYHADRTRCQGLGGGYIPLLGRVTGIYEAADLGRIRYVIGASMLVRAEVFREFGLLSEDYFLYYEELDIAERIKKKYRLAVAIDSVVYHKGGASIGNGTPRSHYYMLRNNLRVSWKYYPYFFPVVALRTIWHLISPRWTAPFNRLTMMYRVFSSIVRGGVHDFE